MKNVIFVAPPAAGKGTQSEILVNNYGFIHISTGDLLREEMAKKSDIGKSIADDMQKGILISDDIIFTLLESKIMEVKDKPFILDGIPRNLNQAERLHKILKENHVDNTVVIYIDVDEEIAMKRVLGRKTCPSCHKTYNMYFTEMKEQEEGICDICGSTLETRSDDNEESFQKRFAIYKENVQPILDYYETLGILEVISKGIIDKEAIAQKIKEIVGGKND